MGMGVYVLTELKRYANQVDSSNVDEFVKSIDLALAHQDCWVPLPTFAIVKSAVEEVATRRAGTAMEALTIATFVLARGTSVAVNSLED